MDLKNQIDPHITKYIRRLGFLVKPSEIQLTRMWVNVMGPGCSHSMHLHPLSVISGTLYVEVPKGAPAIRFEDPRSSLFMARPPTKVSSAQTSALHHSHLPKAGEVVLFESWLRHEVHVNTAKSPRVSVSFNYDWVSG